MKKIISTLLAAATTAGALTITAAAEPAVYDFTASMGMTQTITDVETADGYDTFKMIQEDMDGCVAEYVYKFAEDGDYDSVTGTLTLADGCTLEEYLEETKSTATADHYTLSETDDNVYILTNTEFVEVPEEYRSGCTAEEYRDVNVASLDAIKLLFDAALNGGLSGGTDSNTSDATSDEASDDDKDSVGDSTSIPESDSSDTTVDGDAENDKEQPNTGAAGAAVAAGAAIIAAGAVAISKKRK